VTHSTILHFSGSNKDHPTTGFSKSPSVIVENSKAQAQNNLNHELGNILRGSQVIDNAMDQVITTTPDGVSRMFHMEDLGRQDEEAFVKVIGHLKEQYKLENG
jgi:hypothetical protein